MSYRKKILQNTVKSSTYTFVNIIASLVVTPIIVRQIGLEQFGFVTAALLFSAFNISGIFELGFQPIVSKFVADRKAQNNLESINQILTTALTILLGIGIFLGLLGVVFTEQLTQLMKIPPQIVEEFIFVSRWVFLAQIFQFPIYGIWGFFEGMQEFGTIRTVQIVTLIFSTITSVILVFLGYQFEALVYLNLATSFLQFCILSVVIKRKFPFVVVAYKNWNHVIFREMWQFSKLLFFGRITSYAFYQVDKIFISFIFGPALLGAYEVLMKPARLLKIFSGLGNNVTVPVASELNAKDDKIKLQKLFHSGMKLLFCFNIPIGVVICYFSDDFFRVWMGEDFAFLTNPLRIMIMWNILSIPIGYGNSILLGMGKNLSEMTKIAYLGFFLKLILIYPLLKNYELSGVAVTFVLNSALICILSLSIFKSNIGLKLRVLLKDVMSVLFLSIPLALLAYWLTPYFSITNFISLFLEAGVWLILYWLSIYFVLLSEDEKYSIKILLKKIV